MINEFYEKQGYIIYSIEEWKQFASDNNLSRNDGYGVWAWKRKNTLYPYLSTNKYYYQHGNQNVFLKEPKSYTNFVLWYPKDKLNEIVEIGKNLDPNVRRWIVYQNYINKKNKSNE